MRTEVRILWYINSTMKTYQQDYTTYQTYALLDFEKDIPADKNFFAQFKKIVAFSNLIQRIYHNDIRNMLP